MFRKTLEEVLWILIFVLLFGSLALMLSGCESAKTLIDACRDGLCR